MPLLFAGSEPQDFIVTGNAYFSNTSGRFDPTQSRGFMQVSEVDNIRFSLGGSYSNVYIRAQLSLTNATFVYTSYAIWFCSGNTPVIRFGYSPNTLRWEGWNGSSWVLLSSTGTFSFTSAAITYPVFIRCNPGTSGNLYIKVGDINQYLVLSYTGHTQYTSTIDNVILAWPLTGLTACWSAVIAADENCWDWRMAPLTPNANGAHTAWTGNYTDIDETALTEDSIYTANAGDRESFGTDNVPGAYSGYLVKGVVVSSSIRRSTTGPQNARHFLRIGGTDYDSALLNPDTLFSGRSSIWTTNPATNNPFTTAEVDALEIGVVAES